MRKNSRWGASMAARVVRGLRRVSGVVAAAGCVAFADAADNWMGAIRCEINVTGAGYSHQETQTWTLAGTPPTQQGASKIYAATWNVTGQGWLDATNASASRRIASWTATVTGRSAPIAFLVTPTGELFVQAAHAQLSAQGGYTGADQFIQNGAVHATQRLLAAVYEWAFQRIQGLPSATQLTGTQTSQPNAFLGPLQPDGAQVTVTCVWALGQGTAPPLPPSSLPPQAPPPVWNPSNANPGGPARLPNDGSGVVRPGGTFEQRPGNEGAVISPTPVPVGPPRDPTNFTATQTGDGQVELRWDAVSGVSQYVVLGPGASEGRKVSATSTTVTGVPAGAHEWRVSSWYDPDGSRTDASQWPRAALNVTTGKGRYRVTITRLKVHREEPDSRYKQHGRNNEIFVTEHAQVIDRRDRRKIAYDPPEWHPVVGTRKHVFTPMITHSTPIHGDISNAEPREGYQYRIRAGSMSSAGGIQTGDEIQIWDADQRSHHQMILESLPGGVNVGNASSHPSPGVFVNSEYRPFVCWEGELNDGVEVVLIRPMVWLAINTWGGTTTDQFLSPYLARVFGDEESLDFLALPSIGGAVNIVGLTLLDTKVPELKTTGQWLVDRHRPFGLDVSANHNGAPATWTDTVVVLTREKIESFLGGQPSKEHGVRISGVMRGENRIPMGEVTLFLKIEQVVDPAPVDVAPPRPVERPGAGPEFPNGRYRVTGTRVYLHREEHDKRFKTHGRNNEIAVSKHAQAIDRRSTTKLAYDPGVTFSPVHGDIHNAAEAPPEAKFPLPLLDYRIRAGTVSSDGGIQTGDDVAIWATHGRPSKAVIPQSELVPFVFWEGELKEGVEVVLIRPIVWLVSGKFTPAVGFAPDQWSNADEFLSPYAVRVQNEPWTDFLAIPPIRDALGQPGVSVATVPQLVTIGAWLMEEHRPFGLQARHKVEQYHPDFYTYGGRSTWNDRVVVLTREKVEASLGGGRETSIEVRFESTVDRPTPAMGDCSLFMKIERLP